ncbi:indole-3-glycerol phosphate synthase TrpC [Candidatus Kaiserbacteria bacterium]|nr:indole-3-glycerol phosphate synthase TrpC [Candidatus Kaiserbacteria bacterium]
MNFLKQVISTKKKEIDESKSKMSLCEIERTSTALTGKREIRPFKDIFGMEGVALIAEIKIKSPSEGRLTSLDHRQIARLYAESGADAVSVLTDRTYFDGDLLYLKDVKDIAPQPIFRKDFIIDAYQIYETFLARADAFLLMASLLTATELKEFLSLGRSLGLASIVEVHDADELARTLEADAEIIGINNRNLQTLTVDLQTTRDLMRLIPKDKIVVSESGINTAEDVRELTGLGVRGILVGTSIIKSQDPLQKIQELKQSGWC